MNDADVMKPHQSGLSFILICAVITLIFAALPLPAGSQSGSEMSVDSDFEELGFSGVTGSGKITWKITGQAAQELRKMIIAKYDSNINLPPGVSPGNANGNLEADEIENYKDAIDSYLMNMQYHQGTCEDCHGQGPVIYFGCEITAAQLLHKEPASSMGQAIQVDMKGLLNTNNYSLEDIAIYYKVEVRTEPSMTEFPLDSDILANAPYAPFNQKYRGSITITHLQVLVGFQSYHRLKLPKGSMFFLRTPAGEAIWYSTSFHTDVMNSERISFSPWDFLENPQILFILMIIAGHYTTAIPHMIYFRFRNKLPKSKISLARRIRWIHYLAIVFVILQIVFYFIAVVGPLFLSGLIYWVFCLGLLAASSGLAYHYYLRKEMPKILAMPTPAGRTAVVPTAEGAKLVITQPAEEFAECVCIYCGSLLRAPAAAPSESIVCRGCNMPQITFNPGYSYLFLEDESRLTYKIISRILQSREHALFTSANYPQKIIKEYGLRVESSIWITDSGSAPNAINPLRLEFEMTRDITKFVKAYSGAVIIIDGVNYLIVTNGFDKVFRFIKKLIDMASTSNAMLIVVVPKKTLNEEHIDTLSRELDKCIDISLLVKGEIIQKGKPSPAVSVSQKEPQPIPREEPTVKRSVRPGPPPPPPPQPPAARPPAPSTQKPPAKEPQPVVQREYRTSTPVPTPEARPGPRAHPQPRTPPPPAPPPRQPEVHPAPGPQPQPVPPRTAPPPVRQTVSPPPPRQPEVHPAPGPQPQPVPPRTTPPPVRQTVTPPAPAQVKSEESHPPQEITSEPMEVRPSEKKSEEIIYRSTSIFITASSPILQEEQKPPSQEPSPEERPRPVEYPREEKVVPGGDIHPPAGEVKVSVPEKKEGIPPEKKKEQKKVVKAILSTASEEVDCYACAEKIKVDDWLILCSCGAKYHTKCASGLPACPKCGVSLTPS